VIRHATRWAGFGPTEAVAKLACAMLLSFEGSICLYQGEELGQTETDILFDELTDPPGIRFWPDYKGRDGCRTPMVWDETANGGFTTGTPWLPVKPPQLAQNVAGQQGKAGSVLEFYRQMLAFRRRSPALRSGRTRFADLPEPMLGFHRGPDLACLFNLSSRPVSLAVQGKIAPDAPAQAASLSEGVLTLGALGFAYVTGDKAGEAPVIGGLLP
jgi:alpha-glucosidase